MPATCLKDCLVGPPEDERKSGSPCWTDSHPHPTTAEDVTLKNTSGKRKRQDADTSSTIQQAVDTFLSSGCCIIPNALPPEFVQTCLAKATVDLELLNTELKARREEARSGAASHSIANAYRVDYREMVDRDGGRRDVRFDLGNFPYAAPGLVYNSMVLPLVQKLFSSGGTCAQTTTTTTNDINLLYMGVMWARPASEGITDHQKWHADGGHLFDHCHLPPHCINVFFPLIDVASEHGPTEVQPGSHVLGKFNDTSHSVVGLEAKAGSAILFDYRLKHRGGLNTSQQPRPILYLAFAKPWFRDAGNTRSGKSIFSSPTYNDKSEPWVSRLLTGRAMPMGTGFDKVTSNNNSSSAATEDDTADPAQQGSGSGERWILFKMNVQLDSDAEGNPREETIEIHNGDIAVEVATQFCLEHQLSNEFVPVLTDTIQQQINHVRKMDKSNSS